jgi:hypothetical protein
MDVNLRIPKFSEMFAELPSIPYMFLTLAVLIFPDTGDEGMRARKFFIKSLILIRSLIKI